MRPTNLYSCRACVETIEEDDVVWIDPTTGKASTEGYPYCVSCAPEEKNYENK